MAMEVVQVQNLGHDHPLMLIKKEETDESWDLSCYGCGQPISISSSSSSYYGCKGCVFLLHKTCAELPRNMTHPCHPQHPLNLHPNPAYVGGVCAQCDVCREIFNRFTYHCSLCKYDIDVKCALVVLSIQQSIEHTSHRHQLIPMLKESMFSCDACGIKHEGTSFLCTTCGYWINQKCASSPINLKLSNRHHHALSLIYSIPGATKLRIKVMIVALIRSIFLPAIRRQQPLTRIYTMNASSISANLNNIPVLTGSNFAKWKEHVKIVLGCMDLDYALRVDEPPKLTDKSTADERLTYEKWERSNRMSLMIIKHSISETIRGAMPEEENAKKFLSQIADRFVASEKVEACTLLRKLVTMRYNGKGNIREYIMEMSNIVAKMKALKLEFSEDILVFLVLISLPTQFGPFKINYNTQREKWTLNELIAQCVQEEERMKQERTESAHLATHSHGYSGTKKRKLNPKANGTADVGTSQTTLQQMQDKGVHCFFCKKVVGHVKKDCPKYHKWLAKKGLSKEANTQ